MLRIFASECAYGNRLASILKLSTPAIHRHIKYLEGETGGTKIIEKIRTTRTSYSGKKGAEAVYYGIKNELGLFFHIFKNFIHSHIYSIEENKPEHVNGYDCNIADIHVYEPNSEKINNSDDEAKKKFDSMFNDMQFINSKIIDLEKEIMTLLHEKDNKINEFNNYISSHQELSFEQRIILRSLLNTGGICLDQMSCELYMDKNILRAHISDLKDKGWILESKENE